MATQTDTAATAQLDGMLERFFETKTACDVEGTNRARPALAKAATALHQGLAAADPLAAAAAMHTDVVLADRALRTQVIGRIEAIRYLERLAWSPDGRASTHGGFRCPHAFSPPRTWQT